MTQATNTTVTYSYDPVGNRLSSLGVSPYSVNSLNELTSTPSGTYTYDNNGNTLTKVTSGARTTYGSDYENRLTSVGLPGILRHYENRSFHVSVGLLALCSRPGRPHSSLRPGIPDPEPGFERPTRLGHRIPVDHHVVAKAILGGLHHECRLESRAA